MLATLFLAGPPLPPDLPSYLQHLLPSRGGEKWFHMASLSDSQISGPENEPSHSLRLSTKDDRTLLPPHLK
jgi:hypothetical protein